MRRAALLAALLALGAGGWWAYRASHGGTPGRFGIGAPPEKPEETIACFVWFPSREGLELCEESTTRPKTDDPTGKLRGIMDALHRGPQTECSIALFPAGTAPRSVFLAGDGTAYLDYPASVFEKPKGLREEFLFMRALARSLLRNCYEVKSFVILVEGAPTDRIGTHMPAHGKYILPSSSSKK